MPWNTTDRPKKFKLGEGPDAFNNPNAHVAPAVNAGPDVRTSLTGGPGAPDYNTINVGDWPALDAAIREIENSQELSEFITQHALNPDDPGCMQRMWDFVSCGYHFSPTAISIVQLIISCGGAVTAPYGAAKAFENTFHTSPRVALMGALAAYCTACMTNFLSTKTRDSILEAGIHPKHGTRAKGFAYGAALCSAILAIGAPPKLLALARNAPIDPRDPSSIYVGPIAALF
ncbi:MAG: hypothetical protein K5Q00_05150, partial [Gammaproteobacteria bacterium]|nr:hypothetical protein [Gammaproteobacteria bacterium]